MMPRQALVESGPWLTYRGLTARYQLSESTLRRLIRLKLWPPAQPVTKGRVVFDQRTCDRAFARLLARRDPVVTSPPSVAPPTA